MEERRDIGAGGVEDPPLEPATGDQPAPSRPEREDTSESAASSQPGMAGESAAPSQLVEPAESTPPHAGATGAPAGAPPPAAPSQPGLKGAPAGVPTPVAPVVVPRWIQAVVLPLAIAGAYLLLRAAGPVALIFIVAALVALLLNPFVVMLQRRAHLPRGLAVLFVFLTLIVVVGAIVAVLAQPIGDQASKF